MEDARSESPWPETLTAGTHLSEGASYGYRRDTR